MHLRTSQFEHRSRANHLSWFSSDLTFGTGHHFAGPIGIGNLPPVDEGFAYAIRDVRVRLDIDHSWAADVEATLTFGDLTVGLIYDAARSADFASSDGHEYWFSSDGDELPEFEVIPSGTYRPTVEGTAMSSDLNLFQGIAPEGFWMLHVSDDFAADDGTFFGWAVELDLDTVVVTPEPSAALLLFVAMPLLIRRKRS